MPRTFNIQDPQEAVDLSVAAGKVFQPRAPISTREFFAGRWDQMTTVADSVFQTGLHIVIFGERGVGKTSLANIVEPLVNVMEESLTGKKPSTRLVAKVNVHQGDSFPEVWSRVFDEISWVENRPMIGIYPEQLSDRVSLKAAFKLSNQPSIDEVRRTVSALPRSVFIFDEFDRGSAALRTAFTDLIKTLSDYAVDSTIILVGVSDTVDHLVRDHASIVRSVVQIQLPRMNERELKEILDKGEEALGVRFKEDAARIIVRMSQGLPHYTHLIGLHATREAANRRSRQITTDDVHKSFEKAVRQAVQSIQEKYLNATHSAHREALYEKVILACASASSSAKDALGFFHPADVVIPLNSILERSNVTIATFQKHINEFCEQERGPILERAGVPRAYKYRFYDPLLPPYIFMKAVAEGHIDIVRLTQITSGD
jgi:Cdc6-like AAA superfamily ATPase